MNRIECSFTKLRQEGRCGFIGYITAGDPSIEGTEQLVYALERGGADFVEIGIPYSDPLADGPVIQAAGLRAFESGVTVAKIFECVKKIRTNSQIPLLFLVYYNTIFRLGNEQFIQQCSESGIDGLIVPDLPLEERDELKVYADAHEIALIPLVAPTSKSRIADITRDCKGFVYCVSSMGVTGARSSFREDIEAYLADVKGQTELPIAVGFGVSDRKTIDYFSRLADAVIVGSAIVSVVAQTQGDPEQLEAYVRELTGRSESTR